MESEEERLLRTIGKALSTRLFIEPAGAGKDSNTAEAYPFLPEELELEIIPARTK